MTISINIISGILLIILVVILYKYIETFWSYKIPKPYKWEEALKNKLISKRLKSLERNYYDKIRFYSIWFQTERLKKENIEIKSILRNLNRICENLLVQSEKFIKKDEAYAIQRMLKDFQPLKFARKKDVEDILKEKFDSKINREQRNKNIKIIE